MEHFIALDQPPCYDAPFAIAFISPFIFTLYALSPRLLNCVRACDNKHAALVKNRVIDEANSKRSVIR